MDYTKLGNNIRKERLKQNLTIEELAYKADITPNYLGKIERAQSKLSLEVLIKIANALSVTSDDILNHEFNKISQNYLDKINQKLTIISKTNSEYVELLDTMIDFIIDKTNH